MDLQPGLLPYLGYLAHRDSMENQMPEKPWEAATSTGYRVIRYFDEDDAWLVVHKVYYDRQRNPIAIDFGVADIDGDTVDELTKIHEEIGLAFEQPILDLQSFPEWAMRRG